MIFTLPVRIIHLDDHAVFRAGFSMSCIWPFFTMPELIEFGDGNEAYDFIKNEIKENKKIDLLITDINHPGVRGNELATVIRYFERQYNSPTRIPIVILSMVEEITCPELRANNIVDAYLTKATEIEDIMLCMEKILLN